MMEVLGSGKFNLELNKKKASSFKLDSD